MGKKPNSVVYLLSLIGSIKILTIGGSEQFANEYIEKKLYPLLFSQGTKLGQYTLESDPNLIPFFPVRKYYSFIKYMNVIYSLKGNPIVFQNIFCGLIP